MNIVKKISTFILDDSAQLPKAWKLWGWTLGQIAFGVLWLEGAGWKVLVDGKLQLNTDVFEYVVKQGSENPVFGFYATITDNILLPNLTFFLIMTFIVELLIGFAFAFGKWVRAAAVVAFAQTVAIMLSVLNAPHEWHWSYLLMLLVSALFFMSPRNIQWPSLLRNRIGK